MPEMLLIIALVIAIFAFGIAIYWHDFPDVYLVAIMAISAILGIVGFIL